MRTKRIQMRLPPELVNVIDQLCKSVSIDRTDYFETLARHDLKKRKLFPKQGDKKIKYYNSIEEMH